MQDRDKENHPSLEKPLPQNTNAERAVLGALLMPDEGKAAITKVVRLGLLPKHFYREAHQIFYQTILALYEKGEAVDLLILVKAATERGFLNEIYGVAYLDEMIDSVPTVENVDYYAKMVMMCWIRRQVIALGVEADIDTTSEEELLSKMEGLLSEVPKDKSKLDMVAVSANQLVEVEYEDPPMVIGRGLLPAFGYSVMAAIAKTGKTSMAIQLALSVASGTDFLGFPVENRVNILYCYLEGTAQSMAKLIRQQLDGWGSAISIDRLHLLECRGLTLEKQASINILKGEISKVGAQLVIIDPISRALSRDLNKLENVTTFINRMEVISSELDNPVAWLFLHHYGKPTITKRQSIHEIIGSSGWGNYAEACIGIERYSDRRAPDYKKITFDLRHGPELPDVCVFLNPETRLLEVVESPEEIPSMSADKVADILKEHGKPASYTELRTLVEMQLGISERQAGSLISEARKRNLIAKGPKRYGKYTHDTESTKILQLDI